MPTTENERVKPDHGLNERVATALGWTYAPEWRQVGTWVAPNGTLWAQLPKWDREEGLALALIEGQPYRISHTPGDEFSFLVQLPGIDQFGKALAEVVCEVFLLLMAGK